MGRGAVTEAGERCQSQRSLERWKRVETETAEAENLEKLRWMRTEKVRKKVWIEHQLQCFVVLAGEQWSW